MKENELFDLIEFNKEIVEDLLLNAIKLIRKVEKLIK